MGNLADSKLQVLGDFMRVATEMELRHVLIGAGARVLLCEMLNADPGRSHLDPGRKTSDWDIALPLEDWATFHALASRLTEGQRAPFRRTQSEHRFVHLATEIRLDLIPFGGVEEVPGRLVWPNSKQEMDVAGIDLVLQDSEQWLIGSAPIHFASLLSQAMQKPAAYMDRRDRGTNHDVIDFVWVMKNYEDAGNSHRIHDDAWAVIDANDIDPLAYGAGLLGLDLRRFPAALLAPVRAVLEELCDRESRAVQDAVSRHFLEQAEREFDDLRKFESAVLCGLNATGDVDE